MITEAFTEAPAFTEAIVVSGMNCQHCVASITEEIQELLPAISSAEIDLATGRTVVGSDQPIDAQAVRDAVESAGFRTWSPRSHELTLADDHGEAVRVQLNAVAAVTQAVESAYRRDRAAAARMLAASPGAPLGLSKGP